MGVASDGTPDASKGTGRLPRAVRQPRARPRCRPVSGGLSPAFWTTSEARARQQEPRGHAAGPRRALVPSAALCPPERGGRRRARQRPPRRRQRRHLRPHAARPRGRRPHPRRPLPRRRPADAMCDERLACAEQTCQSSTKGGAGATCNVATLACDGGFCLFTGGTTGTCTAYVPIGSPCDAQDTASRCEGIAARIGGICKLREAAACK
jgi:hypothetical protein